MSRRAVRVAFGVLAVGALGYATVRQWPRVEDTIAAVALADLALAFAAMLTGTYVSMLAWRALLGGLGSPLSLRESGRIFFVGQLGKYLPGGLWSVAAQVELGRDRDVPRRRSAAAALLVIVVALWAAGLVVAATLPATVTGAAARYRWLFALPGLAVVLLVPRVFDQVLGTVLRLARRRPPGRRLSTRATTLALVLAAAQWVAYGVAVWALARAVPGAPRDLLPLAVGAYALAWSAGFLFLLAPAGAGVREGVLTLLLTPAVGAGRALGCALLIRLLATLADLVLGMTALGVTVVTRGAPGQDVRRTGRGTTEERTTPGAS